MVTDTGCHNMLAPSTVMWITSSLKVTVRALASSAKITKVNETTFVFLAPFVNM